jgi:hypothetical protein
MSKLIIKLILDSFFSSNNSYYKVLLQYIRTHGRIDQLNTRSASQGGSGGGGDAYCIAGSQGAAAARRRQLVAAGDN